MNLIEPIVHNFEYSVSYLEELVADLTPAQMVQQSEHIKNHAAWVIGHLTFSCQAIGGEIGLQKWLPDDWGIRFGMGSTPVEDVSAYESKDDLLSVLSDAQKRIIDAVCRLSPEQLHLPLPDRNYEKDLPTTFHAVDQILIAHTAYHVGQTVLWRKSIGLSGIARPFL